MTQEYSFYQAYVFKSLLSFIDEPVVSIWNDALKAIKKYL